MPATGSSSSTSFGRCTSNIPISSHCFWPWLSTPAGRSRLGLQPDALQRGDDPVAQRRAGAAQQPAQPEPVRLGQVEVLDDGQRVEHRRRLEAAADAEAHAACAADMPASGWPSNVIVALRRRREAGDDVDERRLAGAVRADEEAQLALLDRQVDAVDAPGTRRSRRPRRAASSSGLASCRHQPVRRGRLGGAGAVGAGSRRDGAAGRGSAVTRPTMPPGTNATTTTNSRPWTYCHVVGPAAR